MGAEELYFCVFGLFSSPVCGGGMLHVDVKLKLAGGGGAAEGRGALAVYAKAQHCLILHKAFVHSVSKLRVSWVRRGSARHVCVCM